MQHCYGCFSLVTTDTCNLVASLLKFQFLLRVMIVFHFGHFSFSFKRISPFQVVDVLYSVSSSQQQV